MFKKTLLALLIIIVAAAVVGWVLPTNFDVSRVAVINAPAEKVHEYVGDLDKWDAWTPWKDADPTIVVTPGAQSSDVGASQSWTGDSGNGSLTVTKSSPTQGIEYDLILDPGESRSVGVMRYSAAGEGNTEVTWSMTGAMGMPVIGGYFAMMMDSWVGPMFEQGLSKLKTAAETQ